jgi:serine/threonine protein kinase
MELIPGVSRIGHYLFQCRIGEGTFASVWLALHEVINVTVAIKIILKSSIEGEAALTRLTRELNFLKQMHHPFIAEFYEFLEDDQTYYYVMEFAPRDSLLNHMMKNGPLSEVQARHYFSQLISVLEYMHTELHVCHRDVKPENLVLDRHNNVRVIDFGLSNQFTATNPQLRTACGSPPYAPPEMIKRQPYTQAADIWSSGILLYAMVTATLPFDDDDVSVLFKKIVTQEIVYPTFLSPDLVNLLQRMLMKNPADRITLDGIKHHEWFAEAQYESLFAMHLGEKSTESIVDAELVDQMTRLGIETAALRQQLMLGVFDELTAMYRILRRERLTNSMKELLALLPGAATHVQTMIPLGVKPRFLRVPAGPRFRPGVVAAVRAPSPTPRASAPAAAGMTPQRVLPGRPASIEIPFPRRMSLRS